MISIMALVWVCFKGFLLDLDLQIFYSDLMSLKASTSPSKINDRNRDLAGVDNDFDVPD